MNAELQIGHWRRGSREALEFAEETVLRGRVTFGLFFAHLALEKALKAHVVRVTGKQPPYIHNLVKLLGKTDLTMTEIEIRLLEALDAWSLIGLHPELFHELPVNEEHNRILIATRRLCEKLTDPRIEPIPCGVKQWEVDDGTPILEVARQEGIRIEFKQPKKVNT